MSLPTSYKWVGPTRKDGRPLASPANETANGPGGLVDNNPKTRAGALKVNLSLVPAASLIYQALAMEQGAEKYGPYNWRREKVSASTYIAAAKRHLDQYYDGEDTDPESGKPHLAHAIASLGILIDAFATGNLVDDRPPAGAASELLRKWVKKAEVVHASDCAKHNGPAYPAGPCDCGAEKPPAASADEVAARLRAEWEEEFQKAAERVDSIPFTVPQHDRIIPRFPA